MGGAPFPASGLIAGAMVHRAALFVAVACLGGGPVVAAGKHVSASLEIQPDAVVLAQDGHRLPVSLTCPAFTVDGVRVGGEQLPARTSGSLKSGEALELSYDPIALGDSASLEVKLYLEWSARESVLRKWAEYRMRGSESAKLLSEVVLEDLDTAATGIHPLDEQPARVDEYQSHPVFLECFFAGVEFPVASCRLDGGRMVLSHRPGLRMQPGVAYQTRKAVYGVASPGGEKQGFQQYIELNRPEPKGRHCFFLNPFWSTPVVPSQTHIAEFMQAFRDNLYEPYGTAFDTCGITVFTTDPRSIWQVDMKRFPRGLADLEELCRNMGSRLGIFFSPSSCYPPALDPVWAEEQGYETLPAPWANHRVLCLGGRRYQSEARAAIVDMVSRYHASQLASDGYLFACPESDHGHEPGALSAEACADGLIDIFTAVRKAAPDVWIAPTCFSLSASPWWHFHVHSVIGSYGDDAPYGRVPAPAYRESYTSARDYYNLQGAHWQAAPIRAMESFGIIHQSDCPFLNDAVTDILRGNMQQHTPVNPAYMTDLRWGQLAALMGWARRNAGALQETEPLLPVSWQGGKCPRIVNDAVMPREPYGYAHWHDGGGLVGLRNPWIEPQAYSIRLPADRSRRSAGARLSAVSLYPEVRVYGRNLQPGGKLDVRLAPYETVVLSLAKGAAPAELPKASRSIGKQLTARVLRSDVSLVRFEGDPGALAPDSTCLVGSAESGVRVNLEAEVVADAPLSELLVLVEDDEAPIDPICQVRINGNDAPLSSGGSETGWAASGLPKPERWLFLSAALSQGRNAVDLELLTRGGNPTVSAWVWAKRKGSAEGNDYPNALPQPEIISLDGDGLLKPVDRKAASQTTETAPRPIERIDGVFLDALDETAVRATAGEFRRNTSMAQTPITIAGRRYLRGIGTGGGSRISVSLGKQYRRFQSWVGLDSKLIADYFDRSAVVCEVWVDGQKRWDSGVRRIGDPAEPAVWADVDIADGELLELVVVPQDTHGHAAGNFADWAEARLLR